MSIMAYMFDGTSDELPLSCSPSFSVYDIFIVLIPVASPEAI